MKEQNNKSSEIILSKPSYVNKQNHINQINLDKLKQGNKSISVKNDDSESSQNQNIQKITATRKIQMSPTVPNYKVETFNSYEKRKEKLNILDSMSEKNGQKKMPISKEKKIYIYLKNTSNNSDNNSILGTPKGEIGKQEEIIDKLSFDEDNKEVNDNFNKTNIINNINNNNVNNIFVNFISSNIQNDLSRNLGRIKMNNSYNEQDSIIEDGLNKTTALPKLEKEGKIIILRNQKSQTKLNIKKQSNKEKKKQDKLDYYSKIMNTANSFIFNRNSNYFNKSGQQKTDPKIYKNTKNKNKVVGGGSKKFKKEKSKQSKKFLKDYMLKNKSKQIKLKNGIDNIKKHNNSFSSQKEDKKIVNQFFNNNNNPIFINIISKSPFVGQINEQNQFDVTFSSRKPQKKLTNSNTTKNILPKSNTQNGNFINISSQNQKILNKSNYKSITNVRGILWKQYYKLEWKKALKIRLKNCIGIWG